GTRHKRALAVNGTVCSGTLTYRNCFQVVFGYRFDVSLTKEVGGNPEPYNRWVHRSTFRRPVNYSAISQRLIPSTCAISSTYDGHPARATVDWNCMAFDA